MLGRHLIVGAVLFLAACDAKAPEPSQAEIDAKAAEDAAAAARGDVPPPAALPAPTPQAAMAGPSLPDPATRRANIDESIRENWRDLPYEIVSIAYTGEKVQVQGATGSLYHANISVVLKFPSGWRTQCIGPGAPWGCNVVDRNMMQTDTKPIPAGTSLTFAGILTMERSGQDSGQWESVGGTWKQVQPQWQANVHWGQQ